MGDQVKYLAQEDYGGAACLNMEDKNIREEEIRQNFLNAYIFLVFKASLQ